MKRKQLYRQFKWQINDMSHDLDMNIKRELKKETKSQLTKTQNNAVRTNYVKVKIKNTWWIQ